MLGAIPSAGADLWSDSRPSRHPGILDELNRLAFPYRWSTRAIMLDKTDATRLLTKIRRQWFAKRKSDRRDPEGGDDQRSLDPARYRRPQQGHGCRRGIAGAWTPTRSARPLSRRPSRCGTTTRGLPTEKLRLVEKVIQGRDFTCMAESVNAVEAWLGSLPGHAYANVRQPPVSTLNLAHMIPLVGGLGRPGTRRAFRRAAAVLRQDRRCDAVPILASCRRCRPHPDRRSDRRGQVGPSGADGDAVPPLPNNQIFAFDFGGSIRAAALAMGGDWHDLGGACRRRSEHSVSLQPLARIDDESERAWAAEWIGDHPREARASPSTRGEGASLVGADLAGVGARGGAHAHRPVGPVAVAGAEARAATLLRRRSLGPPARCRGRAARRRPGAGVRDRGADRRRRGARRADLSLPSHRGPPRRPADLADRRRGLAGPRRSRASPSSSASG